AVRDRVDHGDNRTGTVQHQCGRFAAAGKGDPAAVHFVRRIVGVGLAGRGGAITKHFEGRGRRYPRGVAPRAETGAAKKGTFGVAIAMKVLIAAGGTGGHIYPGIAVAKELLRRDPDTEVIFVGTARGLETRIVPESGFQLSLIHSAGLKNVGSVQRLKGLAVLPRSFIDARQLIRNFRPHVVVGAGGYVSGPVLLMARVMGVPTMVMDSNALPGFTNRQLARFVDKAALTFEAALPYFGSKGVVIGNPVRKEFFDVPRKERGETFNILIFGGSQGARAINNAMAE